MYDDLVGNTNRGGKMKRAFVSALCWLLLLSGLASSHADPPQAGQSIPKTISKLRYQIARADPSGEQDIVILFHANFVVPEGAVHIDSHIDYSPNNSGSASLMPVTPKLEEKNGQTDVTLT
jgi:hypothetical protein